MEVVDITVNTKILTNEFEYFEPGTISEAINLLAKHEGEAKLIAGGTDVLVDMKKGRIKPKYLVSLTKISDLKHIIEDVGRLRIGAGTTFRDIEESQLVRDKYPLLLEAASSMGTPQVRNMATIGGNICNAIPSADIPPAFVALDAMVKLVGQKGERMLPLEEFLLGIRKTKLEPHELLAEVIVKSPPPRTGTAFLKLGRTSEDLAIINVAARITLSNDGTCKEARIVVGGGVGNTLIRSRTGESVLEGKILNEPLFEEAAEHSCEGFQCRPTSIRGSPYYKIEVSKVLVKRALAKALDRAKAG